MDMTPPGNDRSCKSGRIDAAERKTLDRYSITRVPVATYVLDGYRYSTLADAVAQVRRSLM